MNKENCFKVARNIFVDKEGTPNRKAYVFDGDSCTEVPINFKFRGCFGRDGILEYIRKLGLKVDQFTRKEMQEYFFVDCKDATLSDLDQVAILTSAPFESINESADEDTFLPMGMTLEDFGEADY